MEVAQALIRYHAPSVKLVMTLANRESFYVSTKSAKIIRWYVGHGIGTLLHEIGHHALKHLKHLCCEGKEMEEEADAWLWAEKWSKKHGIPFNYQDANKAFDKHYAGRSPVVINWRGSADE